MTNEENMWVQGCVSFREEEEEEEKKEEEEKVSPA